MEPVKNSSRRWISGIEPAQGAALCFGTQILEIECREQPRKLRELIRAYATDPTIRVSLGKLHEAAAAERPRPFYRNGRVLLFVDQRSHIAANARKAFVRCGRGRVVALWSVCLE